MTVELEQAIREIVREQVAEVLAPLSAPTFYKAFQHESQTTNAHRESLRDGLKGPGDSFKLYDSDGRVIASAVAWRIEDVLSLNRIIFETFEQQRNSTGDVDLDRALNSIVSDLKPDAALLGVRGFKSILDRLDHLVGDCVRDVDAADVHSPCHGVDLTGGGRF